MLDSQHCIIRTPLPPLPTFSLTAQYQHHLDLNVYFSALQLLGALIMITGIAHVNLTVPAGTLDQAEEFYSGTLGFTSIPVPVLKRGSLAW